MNDFRSANFFSLSVLISPIKKFSGKRDDVLFLDEYQTYNATATAYTGLHIILYSDGDRDTDMDSDTE